jgi:serine/threonine protein kinase
MPKKRAPKKPAKSKSYVLRRIPGSQLVKASIELFVPKKVGRKGSTKGFVKKSVSPKDLNKISHFMIKFSKKDLETIELLKSIGVESYKIIENLKGGQFLVERTALPLSTEFNRFPPKKREALVKDYLELTKTLHLNGIAHGHLHLNNVLIDKQGRLVVTDFSDLKRKPTAELWSQHPDLIGKFFSHDYSMIYTTLRDLGMRREKAVSSCLDLIESYKISESKKEAMKHVYRQVFKTMEFLGI